MLNTGSLESSRYEFIAVASVNDIADGERLFLDIGDVSLVVLNTAGQYFAIADLCSHDDGPLGEGELDQYEVVCPRHGARFDVRTGKACSLPAVVAIPAYPVRVVDGQVEVGIPYEG